MKTLYFGYDAGYRNNDSVSNFTTLTVPSVVSHFEPTADFSTARRPGVLLQPVLAAVGNTAIQQGASPISAIYANKNFVDAERTALSFGFLAGFFHSLRSHIPDEVSEAHAYVALAVPRAEMDKDCESTFARLLEKKWMVQCENGQVCEVTIRKVIVRAQPEMAIRSVVLNYDVKKDVFGVPNMPWLYRTNGHTPTGDSAQDRENLAGVATQTVVFDIGSYTSHAERLSVIDGVLRPVRPQYSDIGMWTLLHEIERIVQDKTGADHLKPHEIMKIFDDERYGTISLKDEFRALVKMHWPKWETLFRGTFDNYTQVNRVLLCGRGWLKLEKHFKELWQPVASKHGFSIVMPDNVGTIVADGAFKLIRAWYEQHKQQL